MSDLQHPRYAADVISFGTVRATTEGGSPVLIGDDVALASDLSTSVGVVTAIYLDGLLELSTGDDDVMAADLVLLRRADQ